MQLVFVLASSWRAHGSVGPETNTLTMASIHLSSSTGLWKEIHQEKVKKQTSVETIQKRKVRDLRAQGLMFKTLAWFTLSRQNNKSKHEASTPKPATDKKKAWLTKKHLQATSLQTKKFQILQAK